MSFFKSFSLLASEALRRLKGSLIPLLILVFLIALGMIGIFSLIFIPSQPTVSQITQNQAQESKAASGWKLFEGSTWAKGEKELYLLEIAGFKGQLEKEIEQFDGIARANVMLDIPSFRSFNQDKVPAKASLLIEVKKGTTLSPTIIEAIVQHVTGAIRGLSSNNIAISDTSGRIYRTIDPTGQKTLLFQENALIEGELKEKIEGIARQLFQTGFFVTVRSNRQQGASSSLIVNILVDKKKAPEKIAILEDQVKNLLDGFTHKSQLKISEVDLSPLNEKEPPSFSQAQESNWWIGFLFGIASALALSAFFFKRRPKASFPRKEEIPQAKNLNDLIKKGTVEEIARALEDESPRLISLFLSILPKDLASSLFDAFSAPLQEKIWQEIDDWEKLPKKTRDHMELAAKEVFESELPNRSFSDLKEILEKRNLS